MKRTNGTLMHKRWISALVLIALLMVAAAPAFASNRGTIQKGNRHHGETSAWSTWESEKPAQQSQATSQNAITNRESNLYQTASKDACVLARLPYATMVKVISKGNTWTQVSYGNCVGFVRSENLTYKASEPEKQPPKQEAPAWQPPKQESPKWQPTTTKNANGTIRTFNGGNVNLRSWASTSADVICSYASGTRVRILTHGETWCKVQIGNQIGYMVSKYLVYDGGNPHYNNGSNTASKPQSATGTVQSAVNLRTEPSVNSRSLGQFYYGASVQLLGVGTEWVRVQVNGMQGFMKADHVKVPAGITPHKTVVNNGSYVNLREGAGYEYRVLKQVSHGSAATVVVPYAIWSKVIVKDGQGYLGGYMMNSFLK